MILREIDFTVIVKIVFLIALWVASFWTYFHWKFKKERHVLPPERPDV